jgi:PKD repeat protein
MITLLKTKWPLFFLLVLAIAGCNKDDDGGEPTDGLTASFTFAVNPANTLEVAFTNISVGATSYSWDFGDGTGTYTYTTGGTFTVVLTATDGTDSKTFSRAVTAIDPNSTETFIAGNGSKRWYLLREGIALGIGPAVGSNAWWSFGGVTPLGDRPCILDDHWTFKSDGTVDFESNGTIFIDSENNGGWLGAGVAEGCFDDTDPNNMTAITGEDLSSYATGGDYTYDHSGGTLTVDGLGFYVGLANKRADGDNYIPASTVTYTVFGESTNSIADTLKLALTNGAQSWNFYLVSYHDPSDLPAIPGASAPTAAFTFIKSGFDVSFSNVSTSANSYSWDFGDGGTSTDASPTHTYAGFGDYQVTLTAIGSGGMDTETQTVSISNITFSAAVLSNASGKIWKLDGANSYYVGSGPGLNDYWPGIGDADVIIRACQMDDEFIFTNGGVMEFDSKGEVWAEGYMLGANACTADGDLISPFDVCGSGTHAFSVSGNQITVNGSGAYFGFNKPFNGGELNGVDAPPASITYDVIDYSVTGNTETIVITINYGMANDHWTMRMVSTN